MRRRRKRSDAFTAAFAGTNFRLGAAAMVTLNVMLYNINQERTSLALEGWLPAQFGDFLAQTFDSTLFLIAGLRSCAPCDKHQVSS